LRLELHLAAQPTTGQALPNIPLDLLLLNPGPASGAS
jgi:hypothetical protein